MLSAVSARCRNHQPRHRIIALSMLVLLLTFCFRTPALSEGEESAHITGTVTNSLGEPLQAISVYVWEASSHSGIGSTYTDANGHYDIGGPVSGSCHLRFYGPVGSLPSDSSSCGIRSAARMGAFQPPSERGVRMEAALSRDEENGSKA